MPMRAEHWTKEQDGDRLVCREKEGRLGNEQRPSRPPRRTPVTPTALWSRIQEDRLIHFGGKIRRLHEPGEVDGGLDILTSTGSLLDVCDPLPEGRRQIGRDVRPDTPLGRSRCARNCAAYAQDPVRRPIEQAPLCAMDLDGERREGVDKAGFDAPHCPLWGAQHHCRVILHGTSGERGIGGTNALGQAQEEPGQVHRMGPQIDHRAPSRLLGIEKVGR